MLKKKTPIVRRASFWLLSLLVILCAASYWVFRGSVSVVPPRFHYLHITSNLEPHKLVSGETHVFHPHDKVKILEISTNVPFDLNIRLVADGFDVSALRYDEMALSELMPEKEIFHHYKFRVYVKYRSQELGHVDWEIRPFAEDWLDKADRTINPKKRIDILKNALCLLPEQESIRKRLLDEYRSQKLWNQAALLLEETVKKKPDAGILTELLELYGATNNINGTVSVLQRLIALDPDNIEVRIQLAEIFEKKGKLKDAIREYRAMLDRIETKDKIPIYKQLGYLYAQLGQPKPAISFYEKAAALDKTDANLFYNLSYLFGKIGQENRADQYLDRAVRLKEGDAEGRLKLAQSFIEKKQWKRAEEYLQEILKKDSQSLDALLLMAQLLEKKGDKSRLEGVYKNIVTIDPENEAVLYNLAILQFNAGKLSSSLKHFSIYLKGHPKDTIAHKAVFEIYKRLKQDGKAFEKARILVTLTPKDMDLYDYMFEYLKSRNNYEVMGRVMEGGLKANPKQARLREYLVLAYLKTNKTESAIKQIEEVLKARPKDLELLHHLAKLLEKQGRPSEALKTYRRMLDLSPDHEEAQEAYLRLRLEVVKGEKSD
ncbi:MAG: tetratricopeptide repeat protein [Desulfatiglans sp.]|nr:tetratricopeptide repeat protein [Desulfatiglans sp.]